MIFITTDITAARSINGPYFKSKDRAYDKWFSSSYDIFNAIGYESLSSLGGLDEAKNYSIKMSRQLKSW